MNAAVLREWPRKWGRRAVLAVQFATIFPLRTPAGVTDDEMRRSAALWPLAGAGLGALVWLADGGLRLFLPPLPAAAMAMAGYALATGALHLDGLMDTVDAVGSRAPKERALEIMRDSRVGALGAVAGCVVLIGKTAALSALPPAAAGPFVAVPALARAAVVWSTHFAPGARGSAGLGGLFARRVPASATWTASVSACAFAVWGLGLPRAILYLAGAALVAYGAANWLRRRFGGMTGDTYGAVLELVEWLAWTAASAHTR